MASNQKFSSPELETAFERVQPALSGYQARLDAVSNDIRMLEKRLEESKFNVETWVEVEQHNESVDSANVVSAVAQDLGWSEIGDRFRLLYRTRSWGFDLDMPEMSSEGTVDLVKPLIEMPVAVRLAMHEHLSKLVLAVGRRADPVINNQLTEEQMKRDLEAAEMMAEWDAETARQQQTKQTAAKMKAS